MPGGPSTAASVKATSPRQRTSRPEGSPARAVAAAARKAAASAASPSGPLVISPPRIPTEARTGARPRGGNRRLAAPASRKGRLGREGWRSAGLPVLRPDANQVAPALNRSWVGRGRSAPGQAGLRLEGRHRYALGPVRQDQRQPPCQPLPRLRPSQPEQLPKELGRRVQLARRVVPVQRVVAVDHVQPDQGPRSRTAAALGPAGRAARGRRPSPNAAAVRRRLPDIRALDRERSLLTSLISRDGSSLL